MSKNLVKIISTFFYFGFFPVAPGTFGSIGGLLIYFLTLPSQTAYFTATLIILIMGFMVCAKAEKVFAIQDPPQVVIDEVAGMLISLMFLPKSLPIIICAFILFRGFDTVKIWPAEQSEKVPLGIGIMLDDIVAGIYANLAIQLALFVISIR